MSIAGKGMRAALMAGTALLAAPAPRVLAQTMDYGALETLFGEPVTTSATGKPQRAADVPAAMDIITAEQIRQSGARDIPGVLLRYTSLDVMQYGPADYAVGIRGMATPFTPRLLVLVDGRQVYIDDYGRTTWHSIPVQLSEIRQIEVVKGPNSALFGFNAAAGVINIITFNPAIDRVTNGVVRTGTGAYNEASAVATAPLGDGSGIRLSAGLRDENNWSRDYGGRAIGVTNDPSRYQVAGTGLFRVTDGVQLGLEGSHARSTGSDLGSTGAFYAQDQRLWSLRSRLAAETAYGLIEASVYHNAVEGRLLGSVVDQGVTVVQLSDTLKPSAAHTLRPSVEYRHNRLRVNSNAELSYDVLAAGMMWNWAIRDDLESTLAGRWDQLSMSATGYAANDAVGNNAAYDRDFGTFAYNAGLVWKATGVDTMRVTASRGIGSPSLLDLGLRRNFAAISVSGNPGLNPLVVDNYELGWQRAVEAIDGRVEASVFYQVNRGISGSFSVPSRTIGRTVLTSPYSLGSADMYGTELGARGRIAGDFDWGLAYRFAMVEGDLSRATVDFERASPRHIGSARLGWGGGPLRLDGFLRYASASQGWRALGTARVAMVEVRDQSWAGLRAGYTIRPGVVVALEADGVISEQSKASLGLEPERRAFISLRFDL